MNVAIVTTWFPAGAGYVSKAYRETLERENTVYIYARGGKNMKGDAVWDDDFVTWAPLNFYNDIKFSHFLKWLKKNKIDVILFNEQRYWKPVIQAKKSGYVIGAYIDYYTEETVPIFKVYDFLICNTKRHYSVFDWHPNCTYIPWGTNTEVFKPKSNLAKWPITFIISLGWQGNNSRDRKGLFFALQVFKEVKGECILKIYSQIPLQDCLVDWRNLLEGDSRIEFIAGTYDPFPFSDGDIYIYPSRLDGIGLSLPEAISSGLACITTDNAPMNEFVIDNYNGRLVQVARFMSRYDGYYWPQSNVSLASLKEAMQWYVSFPSKVKEHGENAREFALEHLNWIENSKELNNFVVRICQNYESHFIDPRLEWDSLMIDKRIYPSLPYRLLSLIKDMINYFVGINFLFSINSRRLK